MTMIMDFEEATGNAGTPDIEVSVIKDQGICPHVDKGIDLAKLSAKLRRSESFNCECSDSNSGYKSIWICLECGCFSCGDFVIPVTPGSHAVLHAKRSGHPLVVHYRNHKKLVWCFPCNKLITSDRDNKTRKVLNKVVRIMRGMSVEGLSFNVEDVWFGSGSATNDVKSESCLGCSVRGLVNLGNTCFFNSVVQNLLAIKSLREYLFGLNGYYLGPLTYALRNLFFETSGEEASLTSAMNPGYLFFSLCTRAPEFNGYGQHDSHELLRCLLDGLSAEELRRRDVVKFPSVGPTFVDAIFGGKISSTVSCLECGHSSTIHEPFLDLSLPVPTKKPLAKQVPPFSVSDQSSGDRWTVPQAPEQFADPDTMALDMGFTAEDISAIQKPKKQQEPVESFEDKSHETNVSLTDAEISAIRGFANIDIPQNLVSPSSTLKCTTESDSVNTVSASPSDNSKHLNNSIEDSNTSQIQDSKKDEIMEEQDSLNFDGFGGLFDEPSESIDTRVSTESDPEEIDPTASVESCLECFTKAEILAKEEHAWQCDNCSKVLQEQRNRLKRTLSMSELEETTTGGASVKSEDLKVKRDARKRVVISNAPSILTVQLNRFRQDHGGQFSKLNGHVHFGETMDLKPYMNPRCDEGAKLEYRLVGVVEHIGSMRDGHYVAYVRSSEDCVWYHANDAYVCEASLEHVLSCQAYILFYERA
ncbi:hypothetical protein ABFS82_14G019400 [Erythranthe guttata]|uniref:ubiquitin carboxyl-terminal hydrolase 2-like n=1 Tax=Erythranthe guttata TaxID=4155 RepID=UPI00064E02F0|nr:PREDICTED: ubiquitin carboxyl-terminal hydrolase 2-like [Erythranthe guttata]|eukprot:XP_012853991.1 PREDICTED: ubiquitin carboxyl-terminal hydrolase 2-like [Erythranthe guttata]